ncbi:MAG: hypothetical protein EBQ89_00065 [Alphaproteobacteria bacterium]|nr:hypothetical protein [Alphaproteobacteria bacterium]
MSPAQKSDVLSEAAKAAPPVAITTAVTIGGLTLNEWVAIATLLYVVLQSGWLIWKWYHAIKERKDKASEES